MKQLMKAVSFQRTLTAVSLPTAVCRPGEQHHCPGVTMLPACVSSLFCKLAPAAPVVFSRLVFLQLTVQSWRLAWNFTDGEVLAEAADYFPNTSYPLPGSFNTSHVEIQSTSLTADDAQQAVQNAWFYPAQVRPPLCLSCCMCIPIPPRPELG